MKAIDMSCDAVYDIVRIEICEHAQFCQVHLKCDGIKYVVYKDKEYRLCAIYLVVIEDVGDSSKRS